jgi:signal transduction histidine kinase
VTDSGNALEHGSGGNTATGERLLQRLSQALAREARADGIVRAAIDALVSEVGASAAAVFFVDEEAQASRLVYSVNYPADVVMLLREIPLDVPAISNEAILSGEVTFMRTREETAEAASFTKTLGERMNVQSAAAVPLLAAGRRVGVIVYGLAEQHDFDESEVALLREVGSRIAAAIERDRLEAQLARRAEEAELLHSIASAAAGEDDLERILRTTLERLGNLIEFTGGSIAFVEGDALVVRAAEGPFAATALGQRLARGRGRTWQVIETGESFWSNDLAASGLRSLSRDGEKTVCSYLAVPLAWRDGPFGILEIDSTEPNAFHASDLRILEGVGSILSGPIELARRYAAEVQLRHELDEAKGRLEAILEHAPMGVLFFDIDNRLAFANRASHEALQLLPEQDLLDGRSWEELSIRLMRDRWGGTPDELTAIIRETQALREGIIVHDFPLRHPDQMLLRIAAPVIESGTFSGHVIILIDVSAERTALAQAERALALRDRFISIASHELKTPLTAIKGTAQLLQRMQSMPEGIDEERLWRQLGTIDQQTDRLRGLIDELLDVSRMQSGRIELRPESTDLGVMVTNAVETLPEQSRLRVRLTVTEPLPGLFDPLRVDQVIANLLDNALKYSDTGTIVDVEVFRDVDEAILRVTDRGIGIPDDEQRELFEPFSRASNATIRDESGLGLGLYISRQIVELHRGTITVDSTVGRGTSFTVRLPLVTASHE